MNKQQSTSQRRQSAKAAMEMIKSVHGLKASQANDDFKQKQTFRTLKEYFDEAHVLCHGRTAEQVKQQYPTYPKSYSAREILRREEPEVAQRLEAYDQKHIRSGVLKRTKIVDVETGETETWE